MDFKLLVSKDIRSVQLPDIAVSSIVYCGYKLAVGGYGDGPDSDIRLGYLSAENVGKSKEKMGVKDASHGYREGQGLLDANQPSVPCTGIPVNPSEQCGR